MHPPPQKKKEQQPGVWERLWEKVSNNLKCLKSLKMGFCEEQKKSEIRLKSDLWTATSLNNNKQVTPSQSQCCVWLHFLLCLQMQASAMENTLSLG